MCAFFARTLRTAHRTHGTGNGQRVCSSQHTCVITRGHMVKFAPLRAKRSGAASHSGRVAEGKSASIRPAFKIVRAAFAIGSEREP